MTPALTENDEELKAELERIALESFPWGHNNRFARNDAIKSLIGVINAIGNTATFSKLLNGLRLPSEREPADDGQPTEMQEWHDYDADC